MLEQILIRANVKKQELKEQIAQLNSSASTAAAACAGLLVDALNEEVKQVHDTQKLLERESQLLQQELSTLTSELTGWSVKTQELLEALKHVGDIEHYVAVLKREAAALERVLGQLPPPESQAIHPPPSPAHAVQESVTADTAVTQEPVSSTAPEAAADAAGEEASSPAPTHQQQHLAADAAASEVADLEPPAAAAAALPAEAPSSTATAAEAAGAAIIQQQQQQGQASEEEAVGVQLPVSSRASR